MPVALCLHEICREPQQSGFSGYAMIETLALSAFRFPLDKQRSKTKNQRAEAMRVLPGARSQEPLCEGKLLALGTDICELTSSSVYCVLLITKERDPHAYSSSRNETND